VADAGAIAVVDVFADLRADHRADCRAEYDCDRAVAVAVIMLHMLVLVMMMLAVTVLPIMVVIIKTCFHACRSWFSFQSISQRSCGITDSGSANNEPLCLNRVSIVILQASPLITRARRQRRSTRTQSRISNICP